MAITLGSVTLANHDFHDLEVVQALSGQSREGRFFAVAGLSRIEDQPHGQLIVIDNVHVRSFTTKPLLQAALTALQNLKGKLTVRDKLLTITTSNAGTNSYTRCTLDDVIQQMAPVSYYEGTLLRWKSMVTFQLVRLVNP